MAGGLGKVEHAPLLPPGRHVLPLGRLHALCVAPFSGSATRAGLFAALEQLSQRLQRADIRCEIWLDGSFITQKVNPADVDLSVRVDLDVVEQLSVEQDLLLQDVAAGTIPSLDSYVFVAYPVGHPRRSTPEDRWPYWAEWWGVDRAGWLKGTAVLRLGDSDVGLRLAA